MAKDGTFEAKAKAEAQDLAERPSANISARLKERYTTMLK